MRKAGKSKLLLCLNAIILVICTIITVVQPTFAYAAENENSFETSSVLEDLQSAKVNGQPFDLTLYPFDENKEIQIVSFIEYCYSYRASQRKDYGLYVYIYNPKGLNIDSKSKQNKIQMASSYDKTGLPNSYTKYSLKFCNRVESGDYKHLFYKFKVVDAVITNFHLPESTLIMLVSAFCGIEETLGMYKVAVKERYRFFSFGDATLLL